MEFVTFLTDIELLISRADNICQLFLASEYYYEE